MLKTCWHVSDDCNCIQPVMNKKSINIINVKAISHIEVYVENIFFLFKIFSRYIRYNAGIYKRFYVMAVYRLGSGFSGRLWFSLVSLVYCTLPFVQWTNFFSTYNTLNTFRILPWEIKKITLENENIEATNIL